MQKKHSAMRLIQVVCVLLLITCNFALGQLSAKKFDPAGVALRIEPDERPLVPTVRIAGVRNGNLEGEVLGGTRFIIGEQIVVPEPTGSFSVAASSVLVNRVSIEVPPGMYFVASKKGKYYYPVASAKGSNLSPANRVYFQSADAAEAAGFRAQ